MSKQSYFWNIDVSQIEKANIYADIGDSFNFMIALYKRGLKISSEAIAEFTCKLGYKKRDDTEWNYIDGVVRDDGVVQFDWDGADEDETENVMFNLKFEFEHEESGDEYVLERNAFFTVPFVVPGVEIEPATCDKLGGIKVGDNLSITDDGTLSAEGCEFEQVQVDWNCTTSSATAFIKNKPTLNSRAFTGAFVLSASDINALNTQSVQANLERIDSSVEDIIDEIAEINEKIDGVEDAILEI